MIQKREEDDNVSSSTNNSIPWLSEISTGSWSEDDDNSSPLMECSKNLPLHTTSSYSNTLPLVSSSQLKSKRQSVTDYDLKNARDVLIGSGSAVINFLRSAGVPKPR
jgi:hypothetical protein